MDTVLKTETFKIFWSVYIRHIILSLLITKEYNTQSNLVKSTEIKYFKEGSSNLFTDLKQV